MCNCDHICCIHIFEHGSWASYSWVKMFHNVVLSQNKKNAPCVEPKHISMVQMLFLNPKLYRHGIGGTT
jgi:hypothetical protein